MRRPHFTAQKCNCPRRTAAADTASSAVRRKEFRFDGADVGALADGADVAIPGDDRSKECTRMPCRDARQSSIVTGCFDLRERTHEHMAKSKFGPIFFIAHTA